MVRDLELQRLVKYAESMGVKVLFSQKRSESDAAEWYTDGTQITVFEKEHTSKVEMILSLIHEIGHMCEFVRNNNRQVDLKLEEAINSEEEKKLHRKKIYDFENKSSEWWEEIYRDTDLKFPRYKLEIARELDVYMYEVYCETGEFPTRAMRREKKKQLKEKYKI